MPEGKKGKICSNNGQCEELLYGTEDTATKIVKKVCYCKPGYQGLACGVPTCNLPCGKHGICRKDSSNLHPRCFCDKGLGWKMAVQSLYAHVVIAVATVCAGIKMEKRCATVSQCIMAKDAILM